MANTGKYATLKAPDLSKAMGRYAAGLEKSGYEVLKGAVPEINKGFRGIFAKGQSGWKALSASYVAWKSKKGYSTKILIRTGRMYRALTGNSSDTLLKITNKSLTKGLTDTFYNEYPQYSQGDGAVDRLIEFTVQVAKGLRIYIATELWKKKKVLDKKNFSRLVPK